MKKTLYLITSITLFCNGLISFAQTEKGKFLVGASTRLNAGVIEHSSVVDNVSILEERITRFSVNPYAGYFIRDNLVLGSELVVSLTNSEYYDYESELKETTLSFSLFIRHYFGTKKIKPFLHAGGGIGSYKEKYTSTYSDDESTLTIFNYSVRAGVGFFLNDNTSINLELGYGRLSTKTEDDSKAIQNSFGLSAGFSLFL
ncbi:MAG: outer membrane protein [Flavobacteriaceae bacterium]